MSSPEPRTSRTTARRRLVRKNMVIDQRRLDAARRAQRAGTDTEAVDMALVVRSLKLRDHCSRFMAPQPACRPR